MKQLKFSYELSQSYFNLSKTVSGVFLNPKLSVLYDLPPFLVLLWSPLALSHCSENARYFSCNICNTYILSSSVKALIEFSPMAHFHVNEQCCFTQRQPHAVFGTISLANCWSHTLSPSEYSFCPCLYLAHTSDNKYILLHNPISHHLYRNYKHNSKF